MFVLLRILKIIFYLPLRIFWPSKTIGKENLKDGGAVMVSNHTSNWDTIMLAAHSKQPNYYLSKKELFKGKLFSWFLRQMGAIKIDRSSTDLTAIKNCLKALRSGHRLVIFPEGTRVHNDDMQFGQIKAGAAMIAIKAKVPIIPIYINRTPRLFRKTTITFGIPFQLDEFYGKKLDTETLAQAGDVLANKLITLRNQAIEAEKQYYHSKNKLTPQEKTALLNKNKEIKNAERLAKKCAKKAN